MGPHLLARRWLLREVRRRRRRSYWNGAAASKYLGFSLSADATASEGTRTRARATRKEQPHRLGLRIRRRRTPSPKIGPRVSLGHGHGRRGTAPCVVFTLMHPVRPPPTSSCTVPCVRSPSPPFQVIYVGLHIVTPLISLGLLKYPKLSRDYFILMAHLLEVYPEKVAHLNRDAFGRITGSLEFGLRNQDADVVERCLTAVNALASYHFKEIVGGRGGLSSPLMESEGSNGKVQESISSHFLRLFLQLLLFEDFRIRL